MSRLVLTTYKNKIVNLQKPSSVMQRPGKQLAIQQLAAAIQQQQYQQYMRKIDFILQNTETIVKDNYNYEEPEFIVDELRVIEENPEFIVDELRVIEEVSEAMEQEREVIEEKTVNYENTENNNNIYSEILKINTNEIQQTVLPIDISIKNNNKKKKFNTDKINTIVNIDKQDPFKISRKNMIEQVLSTLITKFMISRQ